MAEKLYTQADVDRICSGRLSNLQKKHAVELQAIKIGAGGFDLLLAELERARAKFPRADMLFEALCEEVGELAREFENGTAITDELRAEAIQVACVAIRIATERTTRPSADVIMPAKRLEREAREIMKKRREGAS